MKVLYAITKSNFGGAQRYVFDLAKAAKARGFEVAALCGGEGILVERLRDAGIRVIALNDLQRDISLSKEFKAFFKLLKILREEKPDVLHLNSSKMGGLGALAGRLAGVKSVIFTAHGWAFNESRPWWQKLIIRKVVWWTIILSHTTICVSEKMYRDVAWLPFVKRKLKTIHNGIEDFLVKRQPHKSLAIGTLSELHPIKGLDIALRGFARVFKDTDATFTIAGTGTERERLEQIAKKRGIADQVRFLGFIPNARELLGTFDIFTLTSRSEGLPYTLLEAGVASLPVITARVGGIPEVIKNNRTGILFEKESVTEFAQALSKLSQDPALRTELGESLHEFVLEHFSAREMVDKTFALY